MAEFIELPAGWIVYRFDIELYLHNLGILFSVLIGIVSFGSLDVKTGN